MTITTTAPVSLGDVLAELRLVNPGRALPVSLGDADVRSLAGVASGPVGLSDLKGKSSYIPMTLTAHNAANAADSSVAGGTVSCSPSVSVTGGSGGYSYAWAFVTAAGCTLSAGNAPSCTVSHSYVKSAIGSAVATVRCTVTDATSHTQFIDVTASLDWGI